MRAPLFWLGHKLSPVLPLEHQPVWAGRRAPPRRGLLPSLCGGIRTGATNDGSELGAFVAHLLENSASIGNLGFFISMSSRLLLRLEPSECMGGLARVLEKGGLKAFKGHKSP